MKRTIFGHIKDVSKRNIICPAIILIVMIILWIVIPFGATLSPSKASSIDDILALADNGKSCVNVSLDGLNYTGYDFYQGSNVTASYYYKYSDDNSTCLFFLIPSSKTNNLSATISYSGNVAVMKNDKYFTTFLGNYSSDAGTDEATLTQISHGILFSGYNYNPGGLTFLLILIIIVIVLCAFVIAMNVLVLLKPEKHGIVKILQKFGINEKGIKEIDNELAHACIIHSGTLYATESYIVGLTKRSVYVAPIYNIVWAYRLPSKLRLFNKKETHYNLTLVTDSQVKIVIPGCRKKDSSRILGFLKNNFDHISVGYSEKIRNNVNQMFGKK